ncbi:PQQ-binding-like beta-propeller repeat protein [Streptomyces sp. NPDC102259]|uniref:outer membrane protein assembly factor BamB family protein n=1 Tax=Streptomyces sp. NPDC102259 TaxID=3366148 RepID=UPI003807FAAC
MSTSAHHSGRSRWSAPVGDTYRAPVLSRDQVYATDNNDGHLYAFNAVTGARLWSAPTGSWIAAEPLVARDTVYAVSGPDGQLHAINRYTGAHRWSTAASDSGIFRLHATAGRLVTLTAHDYKTTIAQQR